jgi:hypothetical protein
MLLWNPTDDLRSIETALRHVIRDIFGDDGWLSSTGAPDEERLREKQIEEDKRRDGTSVSTNLLDYTETRKVPNRIVGTREG